MKNKTDQTRVVPATDGSAIQSLGPGPRFKLGPDNPSLAIAQLILTHQGAEQAITIEAIAKNLWPTEWGYIEDDSTGHPTYPNRVKIQRAIKQHVADLVNLEGNIIVANRGSKTPGYYVPTTKKEVDRAIQTGLRQAVNMIRRMRRLSGNPRYDELAGQLVLMAEGEEPGAGVRG